MENARCILHLQDLTAYDQLSIDDNGTTDLFWDLQYFNGLINSPWFNKTPSVVLVLGNATKFKAKLASSPLSRVYEDFDGDDDDLKAANYILKLFLDLDRSKKKFYTYIGEFQDPAILNSLFAAINDTSEIASPLNARGNKI